LWSPVVATGGKRSQIRRRRNRLEQAKTVAVGCSQLPAPLHGKEGIDGSSPSEGFGESPAHRLVGLSKQQTAVTRGHLRDTFDVHTLFARGPASGLFEPFPLIRRPSLPRKASIGNPIQLFAVTRVGSGRSGSCGPASTQRPPPARARARRAARRRAGSCRRRGSLVGHWPADRTRRGTCARAGSERFEPFNPDEEKRRDDVIDAVARFVILWRILRPDHSTLGRLRPARTKERLWKLAPSTSTSSASPATSSRAG
jgi:hypothetical protein